MVGGCQVDAHSARADGQQEHSGGGVALEGLGGGCLGGRQHTAQRRTAGESKGAGGTTKGRVRWWCWRGCRGKTANQQCNSTAGFFEADFVCGGGETV